MQNVQSILQNDVSCISALRCLLLFLERLGATPGNMQRVAGEACRLCCQLCLTHVGMHCTTQSS